MRSESSFRVNFIVVFSLVISYYTGGKLPTICSKTVPFLSVFGFKTSSDVLTTQATRPKANLILDY